MAVTKTSVLPTIIKQILTTRGYDSPTKIDDYLSPDYDKHLHDPFKLTGMAEAVDRLIEAIKLKQRVVIYGDYDIDGITASAVLIEGMRYHGLTAESYIPDRFEEGYGINLAALQLLKADGYDLVVSVDCGVTSAREVDWANANGLDTIITDHHSVPEELPRTIVINPKQPGDDYPFKDLAGVGVAFKLIQALQHRTGLPQAGQEKWLLDLVALGTICDIVTLVGENRVLAYYGLKVMRKTRRVGLKALAGVSRVPIDQIRSYHLGWSLGPRLNAAGRLEHARRSLELMLTNDGRIALDIASQLDELNRQRQADQAVIYKQANQQASQYANDPILVLASPDWSHGIVGIVASKLVEEWGKPVLLAQIIGDNAKGSARSIGGFNLVEGLRAVSNHFSRFGGHYFAAGFTLKTADLEPLRRDLIAYCRTKPVDDGGVSDSKLPEAAISSLDQVDWDLHAYLDRLEPFGNGNPQPIFAGQDLKVMMVNRLGVDKTHLKLTLRDASGRSIDAIGFGLAPDHPDLKVGQQVGATFQVTKNEYLGNASLELMLVSLRSESDG